MRTSPASGQSPSGSTYSPSVPISVYRQLAAELQSAKATADLLGNQNQQLAHQNQQLRQEIERVVQAASTLQQMANSFEEMPQPSSVEPLAIPLGNVVSMPQPAQPLPVQSQPVSSRPRKPMPMAETASVVKVQLREPMLLSDELFTEQEEPRPRRSAPPETAKDLNGIWLMVIIGFIVITAFGAGFMVVRPLLPNR